MRNPNKGLGMWLSSRVLASSSQGLRVHLQSCKQTAPNIMIFPGARYKDAVGEGLVFFTSFRDPWCKTVKEPCSFGNHGGRPAQGSSVRAEGKRQNLLAQSLVTRNMIATWCSKSGNPALERSRQEDYELFVMNFKPVYAT